MVFLTKITVFSEGILMNFHENLSNIFGLNMERIFLLLNAIVFSIFGFSQNSYPGQHIIGKSYNVFGEYACNSSVNHYNIFDFSRMPQQTNSVSHTLPKFVSLNNASKHIFNTIEGSSKTQYIHALSEKSGLGVNAFFFQASVENQFKQTQLSSSNLYYLTHMDVNTKWRINLDIRNIDSLVKYLDLQFKSDLENLSPEDFFDTYGSHFIVSAYLGGRVDYATVSVLREGMSSSDLNTAVGAKYKFLSSGAENGKLYETTYSRAATVERMTLTGGNSELVNSIHSPSQYEEWASGIKEHPVLSGFTKKSLMPIWILASDEDRREELEKYFLEVIIPQHPVPNNYNHDEVLDQSNLTQDFIVNIDGFYIEQDCDWYALTGDESGDFVYWVGVYVNDELQNSFKTRQGYVNKVWSGQSLEIDKRVNIRVPLKSDAKISVRAKLVEEDDLRSETLGNKTITHYFPFTKEQLSNFEDGGHLFWTERFYNDDDCSAIFIYRIIENHDKTAIEYGNKGWTEFEAGDYDQCLFYSKEALKVDNSMWYVHFNVGLVYLIQGNPRALEKYQFTTEYCKDKESISAALKDITDYESKNGQLSNSEPIKVLLKSML